MQNTEQDTFNKLSRRPIKEVVDYWRTHGLVGSESLREYARHEKYTLQEFLNGWYDVFLSDSTTYHNPAEHKEKWVIDRLKEMTRHAD